MTIGIGIGLRKVQDAGFDTDAAAYFTAAGITDSTERNAVNQFVKDLKGEGITPNGNDLWTDMPAIWPISPTSLAAALVNLRNPGTFDLTAVNAPTHAITGVTTNGTTQYFRTGLTPSITLALNDVGISFYVASDVVGTVAMGGQDGVGRIKCYPAISSILFRWECYNGSVPGGRMEVASTDGSSLITCVRRAAFDAEAWRKGISLGTNPEASSSANPTVELYIGAHNNNGVAAEFHANEFRGAAVMGHGFVTAENTDWNDAWDRLQTNVVAGGRQVA